MIHPCTDCDEEIECGCSHPHARPPCSPCVDHVCYAERDAERLEEIEYDIAEAKRRPAGANLKADAILIDLEWVCDRLRCLE